MLIGISGLAGSGKDTAADYLVQKHQFVKVALADPLKRIARDVYAFSDDQLWGPSQNRNATDKRYYRADRDSYLTPREALQTLGTEWGRGCYQNTWVDMAIRTAKLLLTNPDLRYDQKKGVFSATTRVSDMTEEIYDGRVLGVAIPDVRFRNEIRAIREAGGKVVRVKREGAGLAGPHGTHPSEAEMAEIPDSMFDYVIRNDGSLGELYDSIALAVCP